jgi:hypothetical protein
LIALERFEVGLSQTQEARTRGRCGDCRKADNLASKILRALRDSGCRG